MAVVLFREGDSHEYYGVRCEAQRFEAKQLQSMLEEGWVTDPKELYKSKPELPIESADGEGLWSKIKKVFGYGSND